MGEFGRVFIILGLVFLLVGAVFSLSGKIPFVGKLPGDIFIKKDNFSFYAPITTSIIVSLVLSVVLWIVGKIGR